MNRIHLREIAILLCFSALLAPGVWAQAASGAAATATGNAATSTANADESAASDEKTLPKQFRQLVLGMSLDDLKAALQKDSMFNFRGDRDVSFLPVTEESLVETSGSSFIRRAFFQLRDGAMFIMALTLNTNMMDHYTLFTDMVGKYGQPVSLNPRESVWEDDEVRISIERPLTVKYIDKKVFDDILNESTALQSYRVQSRQDFLDEF